jgi:PAS domain S-box-containing protein
MTIQNVHDMRNNQGNKQSESVSSADTVQMIVDSIPEGILFLDFTGYVRDVNVGLQRMLGFNNKTQLSGISLTDIISTLDYPSVKRELDYIRESGLHSTIECVLIKSDGSSFPAECVISLGRNRQDEPVGFTIVVHELTTRKLNETDALLAQANFRTLLEDSPFGIVIVSNEDEIRYANQAFVTMFGYENETAVRRTSFTRLLPIKQAAGTSINLKQVTEGKPSPSFYQIESETRDGKSKYLIVTRRNVIWEEEFCIHYLFFDITDYRESQEMHKILADNSPVGVFVLQDGRICYANSKFYMMTGYSARELNDMDIVQLVHPDDRDFVKHSIEQMVRDESWPTYNFRFINKNGTIRWALGSAKGIHYNGKDAVVANVTDITEQIHAMEELSYSDAALNSIHEGIYSMDKDFVITRWNPMCVQIFGIQENDAVGKHIWDVLELVENYPQQNEERIQKLFVQGFNREEQQYRTKSGEYWMDVNAQAIMVNGEKSGWITILTDITERKRMENKLRQSEEHIRLLINSMEDIVFTFDTEGRFASFYKVPDEVEEYFKNANIELIGKHYGDILSGDVCAKLDIVFPIILETGENQHFDYMMVINGLQRWFDARMSVIKDTSGQIVEIITVSRDITLRKQTETSLAESEEKIHSLINSMGDIVFSFDLNGTFTHYYQPNENRNLFTRGSHFIGKNFRDVLPALVVEKMEAAVAKVRSGASSQQFDYGVTTDKETRWYNAKISPLLNSTGEIIGITAVNRDITERKEMEDTIEAAASEWETTFDSLTEQVYIIDREYRVVRANKAYAQTLGLNPDDIIGKHCYELVHKRNSPCSDCSAKEVIRCRNKVTKNIDAHSRGKYYQGVTSPIFDDDGNIVSFITSTRDISEIKKIEDQLQQSQILASLGTMVAGIAHEVNNPLGSVLLLSELLLKDEIAENIKKDLRVIHSEAKRAAKIMSTLLTYRKRTVTNNRRLNLNTLITKVMKVRYYRLNVLNISLSASLPETPVYVRGDYTQLTQVLMNILINAEEALKDATKGNIDIKVYPDKDWARIEVSDNGTGIDEENLETIFHPFFTTKSVGEGTGLGLSTCYSIVTAHNGLIHAENNSSGGATIIIELPLVQEQKKHGKNIGRENRGKN